VAADDSGGPGRWARTADLDADHLHRCDARPRHDLVLCPCEACIDEPRDHGAIEPGASTSVSSVMPRGIRASNTRARRCSLLRLGSPGGAVMFVAISELIAGDCRARTQG
jgi:hypothetical protein